MSETKNVGLAPGGLLICPNCAEDYLHHDVVEVRERAMEDGPGTVTMVGYQLVVRPSPAEEFLGRRNDVRIHFRCENCSARPVLTIVQHKGQTFLDWIDCEEPELPEYVAPDGGEESP